MIRVHSMVALALMVAQGQAEARGASTAPPAPSASRALVYVGDAYFPPFEYNDARGNAAGFNVELVRLLAAETGRPVEFQLGRWPDAVAALQAGTADLASVAWSPERAERYDALATTWVMHTALLFPPGRGHYPKGIRELAGERVALIENGLLHEHLRQLPVGLRPEFRLASNQFDAIQRLVAREATVVAGNGLALRHIAAQFALRDLVEVEVAATDYVLVTRRGQGASLDDVRAAYARLRAGPRLSELIERTLTLAPPPVPFAEQLRRFGLVVGLLLALAGAGFAWSSVLRRQVRTRTRELEQGLRERQQLAEALRVSEARFRSMFEHANVGILLYDAHGQVVFANDAAARVLRTQARALVGARSLSPRQSVTDAHGQALTPEQEPAGRARLGATVEQELVGVAVPETHERAWLAVNAAPSGAKDGQGHEVICTLIDVSEARRLRQERERFFEVSPSLLSVFDASGTARWVSTASRRILGREPEEFVGTKFWDHVAPDDRGALLRALSKLRRGASDIEVRLRHKDGSTRWTLWNAAFDPQGELIFAAGLDVTERRRAEHQIQHLAYHDALTGLPNRQLFVDRLETALAHAERHGEHLAVLFIDIDHFKVINDSLGHTAGDRVLREVARRLRATLRAEDTVARLGGDEFTALVVDVGDPDALLRLAQKLGRVVKQPFDVEGRELTVSASIGVGLYPHDGADAEQMLRSADLAMYRAKELGRDSTQFYTAAMSARVLAHLDIEGRLRRALAAGELHLVYQPIVRLASGATEAYEALLRWNDPQRGEIAPAEFIGIAETSGLVADIGRYVVAAACAAIVKRSDSARVTINLSAREFYDHGLVETVVHALQAAGLAAARLEVEITETVASQDPERTDATLRELRALGVRVLMDDFGTGHSSLSNLRRLPLDAVKIDRSFVAGLPGERRARGIVSAVIAMAHELGLEVVAEGVETEEQLAFLHEQRCDLAQGYLLGYPQAWPR
jgi:diguanylate cyclase (GGDEF)-like protein/PAS domain S-box-containing protein